MKNSKAKGIHYLIDLYGCQEKQEEIKKIVENILRFIKYKRKNVSSHERGFLLENEELLKRRVK